MTGNIAPALVHQAHAEKEKSKVVGGDLAVALLQSHYSIKEIISVDDKEPSLYCTKIFVCKFVNPTVRILDYGQDELR